MKILELIVDRPNGLITLGPPIVVSGSGADLERIEALASAVAETQTESRSEIHLD